MRLLSSLLNWFKESQASNSLPAGDNSFVVPLGSVARFSFEARDFFANGKPKARIFSQERHPDTQRLETSVCGLNGVSTERLWHLGNTIRPNLLALAAVEISVAAIFDTKLQCESAPELKINYPEHGVIIGWDEDKAKRLSASQDLVPLITNIKRPP